MGFHRNMGDKVRRQNNMFNTTSNRMLPINRTYDRRGGICL